MWVNIDFSLSITDVISYLKRLDYQGPIYLTLNTLCKGTQVLDLIPEILNEFAQNNLTVLEGPHFVEEGCIVAGEIRVIDELYFATQGEKIIWYTKHFPIPNDIATIILMSADLGIEPVIVHMKDKNKKYKYCFVQEAPLPQDIANLITKSNYSLRRIKE